MYPKNQSIIMEILKPVPTTREEVTMTYDEWYDTFEPLANVIDDNAPYDGNMYETFGEELDHVEHVHSKEPFTVWTLVDTDQADYPIVIEGMRLVNRFGYLITRNAYDPTKTYNITDED